MNTRGLKAEMARYGDTGFTLARALGITNSTLSKKIKGESAEFLQKEITIIKIRYKLSPEQVDEIFFTQNLS